jgi:hypothetical protein
MTRRDPWVRWRWDASSNNTQRPGLKLSLSESRLNINCPANLVHERQPSYARHMKPLKQKPALKVRLARLCLAFSTLAIALVGCELIMRRFFPPPNPNSATQWLKLLDDLPERDQFLADRLHFTRQKYYDYHLYGVRAGKSQTMTFTDFFSARACPDSVAPDQAKQIIWMFGGSTLQNAETTDERTIANQVAKYLKSEGTPVAVFNFGVGSFQSSLELIKFEDILRRVSPAERPNVVVFYDGYNDPTHGFLSGAGNMQSDVSNKLRMLVEGDHWNNIRYSVSQSFSESRLAILRSLSSVIEPSVIRAGAVNDASPENLDKSVSLFLDNRRMARAICREFNIRPLFVLQPLVTSKKGRTNFEEEDFNSIDPKLRSFIANFYSKVQEQARDCKDCLDLSALLDGDNRRDFYDIGHTGPYTGATVGAAIGRSILHP